jgi:uncharacterized lipoprotein YajG
VPYPSNISCALQQAFNSRRRCEVTMKRIVLVIAVTLPLAACGKEQPKNVEVRPVRVIAVQHAPSGETISLTGQIQATDQVNLVFCHKHVNPELLRI